MPFTIRRVEYFYTSVPNEVGEAHKLLSPLAGLGINLLAFTAVPIGPSTTQLSIFPEDSAKLQAVAKNAGLTLDGPHSAILVQGDDELGAFAGIHEKLSAAGVNVFASTGVTDGRGAYGYILYVRREDFDRAVRKLQI